MNWKGIILIWSKQKDSGGHFCPQASKRGNNVTEPKIFPDTLRFREGISRLKKRSIGINLMQDLRCVWITNSVTAGKVASRVYLNQKNLIIIMNQSPLGQKILLETQEADNSLQKKAHFQLRLDNNHQNRRNVILTYTNWS